jgi:hypothetical protein
MKVSSCACCDELCGIVSRIAAFGIDGMQRLRTRCTTVGDAKCDSYVDGS